MSIIKPEQAEQEAVVTVGKLIMAAVTTAPKTRGVNAVTSLLVQGKEKEKLAKAMEAHGKGKAFNADIFLRDAKNVRQSAAVLLIGVKGTMPKRPEKPFNCGSCGFRTCGDFIRARKQKRGEDFIGPTCIFQAVDLGVASGVAAKMAAELNIDNRLMYTAGAAAMELGLLDADMIIGLPLSVSGKNIFFDRG
ncbi:MAG TPA: DUF2148 domain-containing protein [Thermodesulfobacteriota bacterium]|nr:DUF2148 domain-containing protein [Thermodesulfobacteriota bacterium]